MEDLEKKLDEYLDSIKLKSLGYNFYSGGRFDPMCLRLDRTCYELSSGTNGLFALKGDNDKSDPSAKEIERNRLNGIFSHIQLNPQNVCSLLQYSQALIDNNYYDLAEISLAKILIIIDMPPAYNLLAEINIDQGRNSDKREYFELAELLAERGLEIIDSYAQNFISHVISATMALGKTEKN